VKGVGVGVSINQTFGGLFLAPFKKIPMLFSHRKPAEATLRNLLHDFSGSVRDGEMLLVLGRPGSGCSTFLKTIASQTEGYEEVDGEVTYGGLSAKEVKEKYRGEVVYNQGIDSAAEFG
jgi:ATP-binding cassette subfamily G (WHITE) protein 2 (SNQ2)